MSTKSSWLVGESCLGLMTWYMAWQVPPCHTHTPSLFSIYSQRVWWFQSIIWIYTGLYWTRNCTSNTDKKMDYQIYVHMICHPQTYDKLNNNTDQHEHCRSTWTSIERKFTTNWRLAPDYCEWTDPHLPHVTTQFECSYYNRVKHPQLLCQTCPLCLGHNECSSSRTSDTTSLHISVLDFNMTWFNFAVWTQLNVSVEQKRVLRRAGVTLRGGH